MSARRLFGSRLMGPIKNPNDPDFPNPNFNITVLPSLVVPWMTLISLPVPQIDGDRLKYVVSMIGRATDGSSSTEREWSSYWKKENGIVANPGGEVPIILSNLARTDPDTSDGLIKFQVAVDPNKTWNWRVGTWFDRFSLV